MLVEESAEVDDNLGQGQGMLSLQLQVMEGATFTSTFKFCSQEKTS